MTKGGDSMCEDSMSIYKYISFEQFVDLIENEQLYLTNVTLWDDKYEEVNIYELLNKIMPKYIQDSFSKDKESMNSLIQDSKKINKTIYAQSWSIKSKESDAMWKIYSPNKTGVRISIEIGKIFEQIKKKYKNVKKYKINYHKNDKDKIDNLNKDGKNESYELSVLNYKREAFEHEEEYRFSLMIEDLEKYINIEQKYNEKFKINEQNFQVDTPPVLYYDCPLELINEVLLDPRAPEYFEKTFKTYCIHRKFKENNIMFKKSSLYDDPSLKLFKNL